MWNKRQDATATSFGRELISTRFGHAGLTSFRCVGARSVDRYQTGREALEWTVEQCRPLRQGEISWPNLFRADGDPQRPGQTVLPSLLYALNPVGMSIARGWHWKRFGVDHAQSYFIIRKSIKPHFCISQRQVQTMKAIDTVTDRRALIDNYSIACIVSQGHAIV